METLSPSVTHESKRLYVGKANYTGDVIKLENWHEFNTSFSIIRGITNEFETFKVDGAGRLTTTDTITIDGDLTGGVSADNGLTILAGGLNIENAPATITDGGIAVKTLGATISSGGMTEDVAVVSATSGSYTSSVVSVATATTGAGSFELIQAVAGNSTEVWAARANGVMFVANGMTVASGATVKAGGLRVRHVIVGSKHEYSSHASFRWLIWTLYLEEA